MSSDRDISKFLSYVLRHRPDEIGLTLDAGGWARVDDLIARAPLPFDRAELDRVVAGSDKQRFALSDDGARIRASQGHSFPVDLGLTPVTPPETLFHGTAKASLPAIRADGLLKRSRQHVHLSPDPDTATRVGQRHGTPVVLRVAAGEMARAGHTFYVSANGVWLNEHVPAVFLSEAPA